MAYLQNLETSDVKIQNVDFHSLKVESSGGASTPAVTQSVKSTAVKEKEDAKIEGAIQIAIGVKKEVDFAAWYTNVSTLE